MVLLGHITSTTAKKKKVDSYWLDFVPLEVALDRSVINIIIHLADFNCYSYFAPDFYKVRV